MPAPRDEPAGASQRPDNPALPWLVADIGGTNARFGLVQTPGGPVSAVERLAVSAYPGPAEAVRSYLAGASGDSGVGLRPRHAAIAVATAVVGDRVAFTNSAWSFSIAALRDALGVDSLTVLNDFEALALSLPRLQPHQVRAESPLPPPRGTLAVIGPGTGLGVGAVVQTAAGWSALPGEGGHATLAAADDFDAALLAFVRREHQHVSAERLLSGLGLPLLHRAVAAVAGHRHEPLEVHELVSRGTGGSDPACAATLDAFCALLGGFAGNVALTVGARGGVFIGGGIVPRLGEGFFASRFRERFEAKGRFRAYLSAIPTAVIVDTLAALGGAAHAIEQSRGR